MSTFKFRLESNGKIKEIKRDTSLQDMKMFRTAMGDFKKDINDYLTSLVNMEGSAGNSDFVNEDSSSSEEEEKSPKRVLDSPSELVQKSNKVPKI